MSDQLTLDQAATEYSLDCFVNNPEISVKNTFKAGAEWQKEKLMDVLKAIAKWPGNLSDSKLLSRTGPNDAALRGNMVVTMRQIAIDVITKFEPDFKPYQD